MRISTLKLNERYELFSFNVIQTPTRNKRDHVYFNFMYLQSVGEFSLYYPLITETLSLKLVFYSSECKTIFT